MRCTALHALVGVTRYIHLSLSCETVILQLIPYNHLVREIF